MKKKRKINKSIRRFIIENKDESSRYISKSIKTKFNISLSHVSISNFLNAKFSNRDKLKNQMIWTSEWLKKAEENTIKRYKMRLFNDFCISGKRPNLGIDIKEIIED